MTSAKLTIHLPVDVSEKLSRLAVATKRSQSDIAATAIAAYVHQELATVEGILSGLADVKAGRTFPHEKVAAEAEAMIRALQNALIVGEQSGEPRPIDFEGFKARKRNRSKQGE